MKKEIVIALSLYRHNIPYSLIHIIIYEYCYKFMKTEKELRKAVQENLIKTLRNYGK